MLALQTIVSIRNLKYFFAIRRLKLLFDNVMNIIKVDVLFYIWVENWYLK